ncbi:retinoblastoma-like protein 1 [Ptychodera flava]|uniref:retinoblastoma-like protein 1 n=1 Tax=Ptychodera flava TaxID=63121 RepID=UPI00396A6BF6
MPPSDSENSDTRSRFDELCRDLNMDTPAKDEAWQAYENISTNYTLEGDDLHWLACALYVACRKSVVPTVGSSEAVEGNCVSLTRLLRSTKLSLIQFFNKMKKWEDMANLSQEFRDKVDRLERNFAVSTVIFKKFEPIFMDLFRSPADDHPRHPRGRKQRRLPCNSSDVFIFCWTLFVQVKGNFPAISDDLVNSYHLLLCCLDLIFSNAILANRRDILKLGFNGLPANFNNKDYRAPQEPICIIEKLCDLHDGLVVEAKGIKEHWFKPYIKKLFDKRILKGKPETLSGLLDVANFEPNNKSVNKEYEEFVLTKGDFDERIFLGADADEEIGTPAKSTAVTDAGNLSEKMQVKRNLQQHFDQTRSLAPSTPLTGRRYLKEKDPTVTPVSTATQSVSRLQALLIGHKLGPSDTLVSLFKECSKNPQETVTNRVKEIGEIFCEKYAQPSDDLPGSHIDFAKKRLCIAESLYYKALENIMKQEKKRLGSKFDLTSLLEHDLFHKSLFACCLEVVIFSYNSQRTFPWVIDIYELSSYHFYKVIELLIRAEDGLSRDVVKHLNHIEEQILESLAWRQESPLWDAVKDSGQGVPTCEEVTLPHQTDNGQNPSQPSQNAQQVMGSPLMHPRVKRLATADALRKDVPPQSPMSAHDRFSSPQPGNTRRRLFTSGSSNPTQSSDSPAAAPSQSGGSINADAAAAAVAQRVAGIGQTVIPVQGVRNENGTITYIAVPLATSTSVQLTSPSKSPPKQQVPQKPKRTGSLGLFFRKVYHLANVRLLDLCNRLEINEELRRKIWTCFEHSLVSSIGMMVDRHLDQLIMCAVYVIAKVTGQDRTFQEIMKCYRLQPQANSHVYRSVLLKSRRRHSSNSSDGSGRNGASRHGSPVQPGGNGSGSPVQIRSTSTLPVPQPNSAPPTPTRLAGTGSSFEEEDRGDLIKFYNSIYVRKIQTFAMRFSAQHNAEGSLEAPPLSPLPLVKTHPVSPRRVSSRHSVYISPRKNSTPLSPSSGMMYCFNRSPAKNLRDINNMIKSGEPRIGKRLLQDDANDSPKKLCTENNKNFIRRLNDVNSDRQAASSGH